MIKKGWAQRIFDNRNRIEPKALDRGITRRADEDLHRLHKEAAALLEMPESTQQ
jgi:hypothetical protein